MNMQKTSENYAPSKHYEDVLKPKTPAPTPPKPEPKLSKSDFAMLCFG